MSSGVTLPNYSHVVRVSRLPSPSSCLCLVSRVSRLMSHVHKSSRTCPRLYCTVWIPGFDPRLRRGDFTQLRRVVSRGFFSQVRDTRITNKRERRNQSRMVTAVSHSETFSCTLPFHHTLLSSGGSRLTPRMNILSSVPRLALSQWIPHKSPRTKLEGLNCIDLCTSNRHHTHGSPCCNDKSE